MEVNERRSLPKLQNFWLLNTQQAFPNRSDHNSCFQAWKIMLLLNTATEKIHKLLSWLWLKHLHYDELVIMQRQALNPADFKGTVNLKWKIILSLCSWFCIYSSCESYKNVQWFEKTIYFFYLTSPLRNQMRFLGMQMEKTFLRLWRSYKTVVETIFLCFNRVLLWVCCSLTAGVVMNHYCLTWAV